MERHGQSLYLATGLGRQLQLMDKTEHRKRHQSHIAVILGMRVQGGANGWHRWNEAAKADILRFTVARNLTGHTVVH